MAKQKIHPGWIAVTVTFFTLMASAGYRSAPSVLIVPLEDAFGWSRSQIALAVSINVLLFGLVAPFAAALMERFTVRKVVIKNLPFLLSDTVGFIRKLPQQLMESFKSTLDEVREADVLLHVVDVSHAQFEDQIAVVNKTLIELKAFDKPVVTIFNKMDLYQQKYFDEWISDEVKQDLLLELKEKWNGITNNQAVFISAIEKQNIEELRTVILHKVRDMYQIRFPYKTVYYT